MWNPLVVLAAVCSCVQGVMFTSNPGLKCYTCTADSRRSCNTSQTLKLCRGGNSMCMTRQYSQILDEVQHKIRRTMYESRCVVSSLPCSFHCRKEFVGEVEGCIASCCHTNECNKAVVNEAKDKDVFLIHKKRSYNEDTTDNSAGHLHTASLVVLSLLMVLYTIVV